MLYKVTEELDCGAWALDRDLATTFTSGCEKRAIIRFLSQQLSHCTIFPINNSQCFVAQLASLLVRLSLTTV